MPEDDERVSSFPRRSGRTQPRGDILRGLRVVPGILGLWVYAFCSPATVASEDLARHLEAAGHLEKGQWKEAREIYRELNARVREPLRPHARLGFARATAGLGKHRDAIDLLRAFPIDGSGEMVERERWRTAVAVELGRMLGRQGRVEEALAELEKALVTLGTKRQDVAGRVWVRLEMASLLAGSERRKAAIKLLTESLPELESVERAGLRACQKARLAEIYMADGERDWAVTLLEQIRHDPQLDRQQFMAAEALVEGRELKKEVTGRLRLRKEDDYLAIESEGRFELRIAGKKNKGQLRVSDAGRTVTHWFNLEDDPFRTTNLVGSGSLLQVSDPAAADQFRSTGPGTIEILEDLPARFRFRRRDLVSSGSRFEEYTIYPTGQVFVLIGDERSPAAESRSQSVLTTACNGNLNWWQVTDSGMGWPGAPITRSEGCLLLASGLSIPSNRRSLPDDLLLLPSRAGRYLVTLDPQDPARWMFSFPEAGEGGRIAIQLRVFPRNLDSFDAAETYRKDYQSPAKLRMRAGKVDTDEIGDLNADGYNESEGCYVVRGGRTVVLDAGGNDRMQPAIKFLGSGVNGIPDVLVDGKLAERSAYNLAWLEGDALLLHWLGTVSAGERMVFSLR